MTDGRALLPRHLSDDLRDALTWARVVNVVGARQVGKTTLVRDLLRTGRFVSLDDGAVLEAIEGDPWGQMRQLADTPPGAPLIVDEAQRSRKLPLAVKRIVDLDDRPGRFVLTGSSNLFTAQHVTDTLAGRVLTLTLWPMTVAETLARGPSRLLDWAVSGARELDGLPTPDPVDRAGYIDLVLKGGFPGIRDLEIRRRQRICRGYADTVADRDAADAAPLRKTDALRHLIDRLAVRTGSEINVAEMCELVGLRRPTVERYLDVLRRLSMVVRLGAWTSGEARREIRNAKYHFADTGVAAALRRLSPRSFDADADPAALGGLLESFVFAELLRAAPFQQGDFRFYHWRDQRGREIDVLAESPDGMAAFEVKASASVSRRDFRHLDWFAGQGPGRGRVAASIVFHLGERKLAFGENRYALPVSCLWGAPGG